MSVKNFCTIKIIELAFIILAGSTVYWFISNFNHQLPDERLFLVGFVLLVLGFYSGCVYYLSVFNQLARKIILYWDILLIIFYGSILAVIRNNLLVGIIIFCLLLSHMASFYYFGNTKKILEERNGAMPHGKRIPLLQWGMGVIAFTLFFVLLVHLKDINHFQEEFENNLARPIPSSVKILKGKCSHWLDWDLSLVFSINKNDFNKIISRSIKVDNNHPTLSGILEEFPDPTRIEIYRLQDKGEHCYLYWDQSQSKGYLRCRDPFQD